MRKLLQETTAYRLLKNEAAQNRLSHTYLLLFDDEKNLRFALTELAKLFFDGSQTTDKRIENGNHPDCLFFPEQGKTLDRDGTAKIIDESSLSPLEGGRKLFVLDNMHKSSPVVQNKLLKVLEEPPEGVHFLLGATTEFPLLATVKSRAKKLEIPLFPPERVAACLSRIYPDRPASELEKYAYASGGSVGKAQNLLSSGRYADLAEKAYACISATGGGIVTATRALASVTEKSEFLTLLSEMYRDMLFYKTGQGKFAMMKSERTRLKKAAEGYGAASLVFALDVVAEAEKEITFNANLAQCVEVALFKIEKEKEKC